MPALYRASDTERFLPLPAEKAGLAGRSEFRRDYARIVHSAALRRLQGKTQLFSGSESDFFRNRLSHSLEVAQVAKTMAAILNRSESMLDLGWVIDPDLVECAALSHDLGHPPFGHTGEAALDRLMRSDGGFEGNAQTLRLLARLEKKLDDETQLDDYGRPRLYDEVDDVAVGLNLCKRTLAGSLKYDAEIQWQRKAGAIVKGYYVSEAARVEDVKRAVLGREPSVDERFRTVECELMDLADDVAYSTYDVEDAFRAGLLTPLDLLYASDDVMAEVGRRCRGDLGFELAATDVDASLRRLLPAFSEAQDQEDRDRYRISRLTADVGFFRNALSTQWVDSAVRAVSIDPVEKAPALSRVRMASEARAGISVLKHLVYVLLIESPTMRLVARRGTHVVETIFHELQDRPNLLPDDWAARHDQAPEKHKPRVVCDFIAGMTDRQAIDFYARLRSSDFRSMFGLA